MGPGPEDADGVNLFLAKNPTLAQLGKQSVVINGVVSILPDDDAANTRVGANVVNDPGLARIGEKLKSVFHAHGRLPAAVGVALRVRRGNVARALHVQVIKPDVVIDGAG